MTAAEYAKATNDIIRGGFDCCILAAPALPQGELLAAVMPLLAPSACFSVFSNWMQPLAEAMAQLPGPVYSRHVGLYELGPDRIYGMSLCLQLWALLVKCG